MYNVKSKHNSKRHKIKTFFSSRDQGRVLSFDLCVTDAKIHATPDLLFSLCILSESNYMKQEHFLKKGSTYYSTVISALAWFIFTVQLTTF